MSMLINPYRFAGGGGGVPVGDLVLLDSFDLAAASASEDLSIATTSRDLLIVGSIRSDNAGAWTDLLTINFGSGGTVDTGTNYSWKMSSTAAADTSGTAGTKIDVGRVAAPNVLADVFSAVYIDVPGYSGSQHKYLSSSVSQYSASSSDAVSSTGGAGWHSTNAIDVVRIAVAAGQMVARSRLAVYGIG